MLQTLRAPIARVVKRALHRYGGLRIAQARKLSAVATFHAFGDRDGEPFREVLSYLQRYFDFVSLDDFVRQLTTGKPFPRATLAVTFDDGLRSQKRVAYPVLQELGIPAAFYVCPELVSGSRPIWTWELQCRLPWLSAADRIELCRTFGAAETSSTEQLLDCAKSLPIERRRGFEDAVHRMTPKFEFSDQEHALFDLMTWDELAALDDRLITIASHTATHPDLPQIDDEQLAYEVAGSRRMLETRLGRPVAHFAYPNGNYDERSVRAVAQTYASAVTVRHGRVRPGSNPWTLNRIDFGVDPLWATWLLAVRS